MYLNRRVFVMSFFWYLGKAALRIYGISWVDLLIFNVSKTAGWVANSLDPVQAPHYAASELGLHCLILIHGGNRT